MESIKKITSFSLITILVLLLFTPTLQTSTCDVKGCSVCSLEGLCDQCQDILQLSTDFTQCITCDV